MPAPGEHRRRARWRARRATASRAGRRLLIAGGLAAAAVSLGVAAALAAPSRPLSIADPTEDTTGPLDIQRAQLSRATDGRLRARLTFAGAVGPKTLLAPGGPPGSACVRIWTDPDADPMAMRADRLVCVTARSEDEIRGGVYEQTGPALPKRIADASAKVSATGRSVIIRVSQSSLGRPKLIRVAVESTSPGCKRISCIDTVPDNGSARRFRLR